MNRIHIRRLVSAIAALAAVLAGIIDGAPAAFARADPPGGSWARPRHPIPFPPHAHAAAAGGIAHWQVALVLVGAVILGAVAVLIRRARATRRRLPATSGWTEGREAASSSAAS
jgi:hypothetical protein